MSRGPKLRILILAPNYIKRPNWGHQLWRNAIAEQHDVVFSWETGEFDARRLWDRYGPFDVATVGENPRHISKYKNVADLPCLKVCFLSDYLGPNVTGYNSQIKMKKIDIAFLASKNCMHRFNNSRQVAAVPVDTEPYWLPWHVDTDIYKPLGLEREYDVMCVCGLYSPVYPLRGELMRLVEKMPYKTVTGSWTHGNYKHKRYVEILNKSKIFVCANGIHNEVTMKYTEAMACGTLFVTNKPRDADVLGFVDGETMVFYTDFNDMHEKVAYYLKHDNLREEIAWKGLRHVEKNFSMKHGVDRFTNIVQRKLKKLCDLAPQTHTS